LANGELLKAAEEAGFEILLTTDKNMVSQQNLKGRTIAIVVLGNSQWRIVQRYVRRIAASVNARDTRRLCRGGYTFQVRPRHADEKAPLGRQIALTELFKVK